MDTAHPVWEQNAGRRTGERLRTKLSRGDGVAEIPRGRVRARLLHGPLAWFLAGPPLYPSCELTRRSRSRSELPLQLVWNVVAKWVPSVQQDRSCLFNGHPN